MSTFKFVTLDGSDQHAVLAPIVDKHLALCEVRSKMSELTKQQQKLRDEIQYLTGGLTAVQRHALDGWAIKHYGEPVSFW